MRILYINCRTLYIPLNINIVHYSYDVIFLAGLKEIVSRFHDLGGRVVFGAESFCWPDKSLASVYPHNSRGKQYLNSGGNCKSYDSHEIQYGLLDNI